MNKKTKSRGKMDVRKDILWRVYVIYFLICLMGIGIIYKTFQIQNLEGDKWRSLAETATTEVHKIEAVRGNIYASEGSLLATSIPNYEIRFDTQLPALTDEIFDANVDSLAFHLAILFPHKTERAYRKELVKARREGKRYHLIQRSANYNQLKTLKQFPICRLGRYRGGFIYKQINRRQKPFNQLAARTIGFDRPDVRPVGLEGAYAKYLRGVDGHRLEQKISGGVWKPIHDAFEVEPQDGSDIMTTIDVNIQDVAQSALAHQLAKNDADHGCVVLMEVATGEIKAIANLKRSNSGSYYEWYNYAVGESTEPGSTFKLSALVAAIEDGHLSLDDTVDTEDGSVQFYDQVMHDSHRDGYGVITVQQAFEVSSNTALAKLINRSYKNDPQQFVDRLYRMGLNDVLGVDIAGEGRPMIKKPKDKDWSGITLPWMAVGYELMQTPLQILTFYNAIANDGRMVKPQFIKEIKRRGKVIKSFPTEVLHESICSRETIEDAKTMLEGVITDGTGRNLRNSTYKIAGKTGTARIANGKYGYKYEGKYSYQASFCGYFPADNPKYSCIVVVNAPSKNVYYGNQVAGPIFRDIADKVYASSIDIHENLVDNKVESWTAREDGSSPMPYVTYGFQDDLEYILSTLDIPADYQDATSTWAVAIPGDSMVSIQVRRLDEDIEKGKVPNVIGMTAQDAIFVLENTGLRVRLVGGGMIVKQSIKAGTKIYSGSEIILELS